MQRRSITIGATSDRGLQVMAGLSAGDRVLMYETGQFATLWEELAERLGLEPEFIAGDWRHGADPDALEARLAADTAHDIKAVCVVHNETSTGSTSRIAAVRAAIDRAEHPALFMVDTIHHSLPSTTGTTSGVSTSPSVDRKKV